jgi:hypothetical protein
MKHGRKAKGRNKKWTNEIEKDNQNSEGKETETGN